MIMKLPCNVMDHLPEYFQLLCVFIMCSVRENKLLVPVRAYLSVIFLCVLLFATGQFNSKVCVLVWLEDQLLAVECVNGQN